MRWEDIPLQTLEGYSFDKPADLAVLLEARLRPHSAVLDLGCGGGRHLRFLSERGHMPVGLDPNKTAVQAVKNALPTIPGYLMTLDATFPFEPASFDAVLSTYAIYHGLRASVEGTVKECIRLLRPGGLFFAHFISDRDFKCGVGPELETRSFLDGREGEPEAIHHFFNFQEITRIASLFTQCELSHEERPLADANSGSGQQYIVSCHWIIKGTK